MSRALRSSLPLVAVLSLFLLGCGGGKGEDEGIKLQGKVTYQGKPVTNGSITFHEANGGVWTASLDDNGGYAITGVPKGKVKVTVENEHMAPPPGANMKDAAEYMKKSGQGAVKVARVPDQYRDLRFTPLTLDVTGAAQTKDFALK